MATGFARCEDLNQILADTMTLRDLYRKHYRQRSDDKLSGLHRLFDHHGEEQAKLGDDLARRIQGLGGDSLAMAADVAEVTRVPRPPRGRETGPVQLSRLLEAHEIVIRAVWHAVEAADDDVLVRSLLRTNERQVWFLAEHLVPGGPRHATEPRTGHAQAAAEPQAMGTKVQ